jgi:hypothetical protein
MAAPAFSAVESSLASATLAAFVNIRLSNGVDVLDAVLDRGVETLGEYGLSNGLRDRITVARADAEWFAPGLPIEVDPATYSATQRLAMPRAAWYLDRMVADDGYVQIWWLK